MYPQQLSLTAVSLAYAQDVGDIGQSIYSLVTKSRGWTDDEKPASRQYGVPPPSSNPDGNADGSYGALRFRPSNLLAPHAEILSLVESFIRLKGEVASRFYALVADNYDLIRSVYNVIISKISTLHSFSLVGIQVLRKIVEFAVQCLSQWEITVPSISFGASYESAPKPSYGTPGVSAAGNFHAGGYY